MDWSGGGGKGGDDGGCGRLCVGCDDVNVDVPFVAPIDDSGGLAAAAAAAAITWDFDWYCESLIFGGGIALPVGRFLNGRCNVLQNMNTEKKTENYILLFNFNHVS